MSLNTSSMAEGFPLAAQEAEEDFDRALIKALEQDIVPHLGNERIPDHVISLLGKVLQNASLVRGNGSEHRDILDDISMRARVWNALLTNMKTSRPGIQ